MQRNAIVSLLAARLGQRADLGEAIVAEMDFVQETVLEGGERLPWFLEVFVDNLALASEDDELPFPVDFLMEFPDEDQTIWVFDTAWKPLEKGDYDKQVKRYTEAGVPEVYSITATGFRFPQLCPAGTVFKLRYMGKDALCSVSTENQWMKHASDVLMAETGQIIARYMQNQALEQAFMVDAGQAWERLWGRHEQRKEAGRVRGMKDL